MRWDDKLMSQHHAYLTPIKHSLYRPFTTRVYPKPLQPMGLTSSDRDSMIQIEIHIDPTEILQGPGRQVGLTSRDRQAMIHI